VTAPAQPLSAVDLITDPARIGVDDVLALFAAADWTKNRSREEIQQMLRNSQVAVLAKVAGRPVGFARAITDRTFRAFVEDVVVAADLRGAGVGRLVMETVEALVKAQGIARLELTTTQTGFWEKLGYAPKTTTTYMVKSVSP